MPVMSQRAYARQRGVSVSTVQKAIGTGRIHTLPNGQIDSEIADAEWARNTQTQAPPVDRRGQQPEDDAEVFGASQYTKARAVREHYQARVWQAQEDRLRQQQGSRSSERNSLAPQSGHVSNSGGTKRSPSEPVKPLRI
jgi:hypothetical protein